MRELSWDLPQGKNYRHAEDDGNSVPPGRAHKMIQQQVVIPEITHTMQLLAAELLRSGPIQDILRDPDERTQRM